MVIVFDNSTEQIVAQLKGHSKKITQTIYHPDEVSIIYIVFLTFLMFNKCLLSLISLFNTIISLLLFKGHCNQRKRRLNNPRMVSTTRATSSSAKDPRREHHRYLSTPSRRLPPIVLTGRALGILWHPHRQSASPRVFSGLSTLNRRGCIGIALGTICPGATHMRQVPPGRHDLRHGHHRLGNQDLGLALQDQPGQLRRTFRTHQLAIVLRKRLLFGYCCWGRHL